MAGVPPEIAHFEEEVKKLRVIQRELTEVAQQRQQLMSQKSENELVLRELRLVSAEEGKAVYKLVGPVLVRQSKEEAVETVTHRLEFIGKQLSEREARKKELEDQAQKQHALVCFSLDYHLN